MNNPNKLGKKLNITSLFLAQDLAKRGFARCDLITNWEAILTRVFAKDSNPERIRKISDKQVLFVKVRFTRVLEFQYEKTNFIRQINLFAGFGMVDDIKFVRSEKIIDLCKKTMATLIQTPKEKHHKLLAYEQEKHEQCSKELRDAFHQLAHLIMPASKVNKPSIPTPQPPPVPVLNSWRSKAKDVFNNID